MGRKKQKTVEFKPFCYYCDKEFDDVPTLQQHQKLRHFSCPTCNKKFSSGYSMSTHAQTVHKDNIQKYFFKFYFIGFQMLKLVETI